MLYLCGKIGDKIRPVKNASDRGRRSCDVIILNGARRELPGRPAQLCGGVSQAHNRLPTKTRTTWQDLAVPPGGPENYSINCRQQGALLGL